MSRRFLPLVVAAILPALAGGRSSVDDDAADAIREIFDGYETAMLAGDADAWIANWTEDPVAFWADVPTVVGGEDMLAAMEDLFGFLEYTAFDIEVLEVITAGDWAFARGTFTAVTTIKETGEQGRYDGKYLTVFQKQGDGSWKIHRDIYNSNVPPE